MQSLLTFGFVYLYWVLFICSLLTFDRLAVLKSVKIFIFENFEKQLTKHHFYPHLNNKQEGNNNKKTQSKKQETRPNVLNENLHCAFDFSDME